MHTSRKITITLPDELIQKIDIWGKHDYSSRSDVIRMSLLAYFRDPQRLIVFEPNDGAIDKMYEQIKEYYPYLSRDDEELVKFLYDEKMSKME